MILATGLTPVWQLTYRLNQFVAGEVNRAEELRRCASGKVLNVGLVVHRYGAPVTILSVAGGATGESMERDLCAMNVRARFIHVAAETRICTTILVANGPDSNTMTELVENGGPLSALEKQAYAAAFAEESLAAQVVILSGSPPQGMESTFYRQLVESALRNGNRGKGSTVICDFRGACLIETLPVRPTIIKPNRAELMETVVAMGYAVPSSIPDAVRTLQKRGARWVVVTDGSRPTYVADPEGGETWLPTPTPRQVVNPLGCGDAMAAGIAVGLRRGLSVPDAVRLGQIAAMRNLEQPYPGRPDPTLLEFPNTPPMGETPSR